MTSEQFLTALGDIDDSMITDAREIRKKNHAAKYISAAAIAVIILAPPLIVSGSDSTYRFLYGITPKIAQSLKSVKKSCTNNGITMEVISADISGSKADICISLHDSENRLDETIDLFDSYYINCPFDSNAHCAYLSFDKETSTAFFLIEIERTDGKPINKNKITFGVREMIFGKKTFSGNIDKITLSDVEKNPETTKVTDIRGVSYYENAPDESAYDYLVPRKTADIPLTDGVILTGLGYIDGALHIQTYYEDISKTDNHGNVCLADSSGKIAEPYKTFDEFTVSYWDNEHKGSYNEKIIFLPYEMLSDYSLYGNFVTSTGHLDGNWEVTFSPEK